MKGWKLWAALIAVAAWVYFIAFHWSRFLADFWPLDASRIAPNVVASIVQWTVIIVFAALLWPPTRKALHRYITGHVADLKSHITSENAKIHDRIDHTHARIDAIHEHLGITPKGPESLLEAPMTPVKPKRVRKIIPKV